MVWRFHLFVNNIPIFCILFEISFGKNYHESDTNIEYRNIDLPAAIEDYVSDNRRSHDDRKHQRGKYDNHHASQIIPNYYNSELNKILCSCNECEYPTQICDATCLDCRYNTQTSVLVIPYPVPVLISELPQEKSTTVSNLETTSETTTTTLVTTTTTLATTTTTKKSKPTKEELRSTVPIFSKRKPLKTINILPITWKERNKCKPVEHCIPKHKNSMFKKYAKGLGEVILRNRPTIKPEKQGRKRQMKSLSDLLIEKYGIIPVPDVFAFKLIKNANILI